MAFARTPAVGTLAQRLLPRSGPLAQPLVHDVVLVAAGTLLMALCARVSIPVPWSDVPITLQTFGVYLVAALYGPRLGAITMLAYLAEGLLGLPVFSFGRSAWSPSTVPGVPLIFGPTAGYLFAFPFAAMVVGTLASRGWDRRVGSAIPAMFLGSATILTGGFLWRAGTLLLGGGELALVPLFVTSVLGFIPGDVVKILLASLALPGGWRLLGHRGETGGNA